MNQRRALTVSSFRARAMYQRPCSFGCGCACHSHQQKVVQRFQNRFLGNLFLGQTGLPYTQSRAECTNTECYGQMAAIWLDYMFPPWFICWAFTMAIGFRGWRPEVHPLQVYRAVSIHSRLFQFSRANDEHGLAQLFKTHQAWHNDVSATGNHTALHVRLCLLR